MTVPPALRLALLDTAFDDAQSLRSVGALQQRLGQLPLDEALAALVFAPATSLWGVIRGGNGEVFGLIVLGPRGDRDPYRERDLREIQRLLTAAALAFTNSVSYTQQVQAQQTIRQLYRHLQQAQEQTAAAIARVLHDEVLNLNVRLNIAALHQIVGQVVDPKLRADLQLVLDGEQDIGQILRLICEQLRPSGSDDPLGLADSLRRQVERPIRGRD
jgi:signal transduction histidine kinase